MSGFVVFSKAVAICALTFVASAGLPQTSRVWKGSGSSLQILDNPGIATVGTPSSARAAASAARGHYQTAAEKVAQTQAALADIKVEAPDDDIPHGVVPLLTSLKHRLRDLVMTILNAESPDSISPDMVQAIALSSLSSAGARVAVPREEITEPPYEREYAYGDINEVAVRQPTSDPDLLTITTTLGVCCGEDSSLYVVRREGSRWAIVIAEEANGYTEVSGALGYFQYYLTEPDKQRQFFLVTANVTPWCTSNWQGLRYRVTRPGTTPYSPTVLLAAQESIFLGNDPVFELSEEPAGFSLKFRGDYSLDGGILIRDHILSYQVQGRQITRINPVATCAEDFLDEWVAMSWHDAARWSDPFHLSSLRRWHSFLRKKSWSSDGLLFVQPCPTGRPACAVGANRAESPSTWQIGLGIIPEKSDNSDDRKISDTSSASPFGTGQGAPQGDAPPSLFFTVIRRGASFVMTSIDPQRPPGCPGETPPEAFSRK